MKREPIKGVDKSVKIGKSGQLEETKYVPPKPREVESQDKVDDKK